MGNRHDRRNKKRREKKWWRELRSYVVIWEGTTYRTVVQYVPWVPFPWLIAWCPVGWSERDHDALDEVLFLRRMCSMKKPIKHDAVTGAYAASLEGLLDTHPILADFLTSTAYDGEAAGTRQTATLMVFAQDGAWKACLRDRAEQRCLWVAAPVFGDLLSVLEDALANNSGVWRDDRASGYDTAKRQKPPRSA